ncbi:disks large homolog 5-like [Grammomys surdaster]|uniref:disks large homolog 5-like n=1 Tax=Grammomys surdaster TaxID=491861 RepID=UPI0010A00A56|nr:disks large homolog 5-like [Grammomys surdaster]
MSLDMISRLRRLFGRAEMEVTETRERQKVAGLSSESNEGRRRWSWGMWMAGRQSSCPATVLSKKEAKKEEKRLTKELELSTQERNELRDRLIYVTEGSMNKRPYYRQNPLYEKLKLKEKTVMSFLNKLEMENTEFCENVQEHKKEINFYRNLQSRLLLQSSVVKKSLVKVRQDCKEVQADSYLLQQYLTELNLNVKDEQQKINNLPNQQQQDKVSETARELELDTSQEESLLQNELSPQEPPVELPPQQPQTSLDESPSS